MTYKLNPFTGKLDTSDGPQGPAGVVSAAGPGSEGTPSISFAADLDTGLYNYTANGIAVSTGGTGKLFIDSSGKLGLGTSSPDQLLHLESSSSFLAISNTSDTGPAGIVFRRTDNNQNRGSVLYDFTSDALTFRASVNAAGEDVRIDSDGRLLVGTTSSATGPESQYAKLVVAGNTNNSTAAGILNIQKGSGAGATDYLGRVVYSDNDHDFAYIDSIADGSTTAGRLVFSTTANSASSPTERMRIDSSGDVGIGGTLPSSPNITLNSNGSATFTGSVSIGGTTGSNTIDEYEDGNWLPVPYGSTTAGTFTSNPAVQTGGYVRVGRTCTVWCRIQGALTGAAGDLRIGGLPFTARWDGSSPQVNVQASRAGAIAQTANTAGFPTGGNSVYAQIKNYVSYVELIDTTDSNRLPLDASLTTTPTFYFNITYRILQ